MCQIGLVIGFRGRIQLRMNGLQIKLSTNFTFMAENPYNSLLYPTIVIFQNPPKTANNFE